ncbi:hypothetical protein QYE76_007140 [Lolium multiflorum]|uniref:DUF4283 domain-containing protein n=1 Tax=Lolium multiflorum TaxID=4521 RepID=A0AAD8RW04_LOLMU|nr:hypothetical protein QYE76_007140 [Lolium multiflorum]
MMGRLKLTAKEAQVFVLDDSSRDVFNGPEWALVGKVMAPNTLHVDTIKAALKAAWGNPKGMSVRSMGPNLFLAEFESEADKRRVINGSLWLMRKNAILLKEFDPRIQPPDVIFDRLLMWVRIYGLPFPLINSERGTPLPSNIGEVVQVEVDEKDQKSSSGQGSLSGQGSSNQPAASAKKDGEVSSPVKPRKSRARKTNVPAKDQDNIGGKRSAGKKRKQVYVAKTAPVLAIMNMTTDEVQQNDELGMLDSVEAEKEALSGDSNKQKSGSDNVPVRSADLAAAVDQPSDTQ